MLVRDETGLSFDDVLLVPKKGKVKSRNDVLLSTRLAGHVWLSIPVVSSPMSTVTEWQMARRISELGGMGFIHRFMSIEDQVDHFKKAEDRSADSISGDSYQPASHWIGCALGIGSEKGKAKKAGKTPYERISRLYAAGCKYFILDVAHGHSTGVQKYMDSLPGDIKRESTIISGSIATGDGARFSVETGFDGVRVGIGNGSACTTREQTGAGVPQLTAIMEIADAISGLKTDKQESPTLICDGGIRTGSDAVKALAAGATAIMLGQYLGGCDESPSPGEYHGMASEKVQRQNNGVAEYIEGESGTVKKTGSLERTLRPLLSGIRSGISYSGASSIVGLQDKAEFIKVSPGTYDESRVRINV